MSEVYPETPLGSPAPAEVLTAPAPGCPVEARFADGYHRCLRERHDDGDHDYDSDRLPYDGPAPSPMQQPQPVVRVTEGPVCGCPQQGGITYHQRGSCPDPVVARLDWYGTPPAAEGPAPELAAAMAETRAYREGYRELIGEFGPGAQTGWSARVSLTVLNRHRANAGLDRFTRTESNQREDPLLRYRRERDEAREERDAAAGRERCATMALAEELAEVRSERDRLQGALEAESAAHADERGKLRGQLADAKAALRDIKDAYPPGHHGHDTAHAALDRLEAPGA